MNRLSTTVYSSMLRVIDETQELSDDDDTICMVEPEFLIPCDELIESSYSTIDYQIDAFILKIQEKYITNPIMVRYQLSNIFTMQLSETCIPYDIITLIEKFLPLAPNMSTVRFVSSEYWLNQQIDGNDILRTERSKKEKYCRWKNSMYSMLSYYNNYTDNFEDEQNESKIVINLDEENYLTYDLGEFCQIHAILIKTNRNGLGKHVIKIKIPNKNQSEWITIAILSICASYDGWLGFNNLNILTQIIQFEFDANGAVVNELRFV